MNTNYGMEIVRATEIAALTAARMQGLGNHTDILNRARSSLIKVLNRMPIDGTIVNDRFTPRSDIIQFPAKIGQGGEKFDLMAIPLEAYRSAADGKNNASAFAVIAENETIQSVPNLNMYKIVVGAEAGEVIDINQAPVVNVKRVARALKKYTENITVCILNQTRHNKLIHEVRECGARIKLIDDGEISGCLSAITGEKADIYIGYGFAPEAVMVAAAISCLGGYFEGKIFYENDRDRAEARRHGITDFEKTFHTEDLIKSHKVAFAATGVSDGEFLEGVRFTSNGAQTSSFVARGETHTYRQLRTTHFFDYKPVF
ncbi:MAG: fructose-bisphosphatase class II family protein [Desulforhopalus sp.]|nr:fructose-bisphosphatase class II family protein [Desulforhopalus sp.]